MICRRSTGFANARDVRNLWEMTKSRQIDRALKEGSDFDLSIQRDDLLGPKNAKGALP